MIVSQNRASPSVDPKQLYVLNPYTKPINPQPLTAGAGYTAKESRDAGYTLHELQSPDSVSDHGF